MGKYGFTPYRILNRLTFFKPMGPNQPQMGQTGYQSTPLYLCIQNIKLVGKFEWKNIQLRFQLQVISNVHGNRLP